MNYVVVDLEWNQATSSKSSVFNHLPIHLRGEIIEIGAVKLKKDFSLGEEFVIDIKPVYFRRMHYKVKKITGFDKERLSNGVSFPDAISLFRAWCGDGVTFITWGSDDRGIFEQNIIVHDLDWDWIEDWINLQLIFNLQTGGDKSQKSLSSAMEHFGIDQTRTAHDALGDAYNTALVSSKLDLAEGLKLYPEAERILSGRTSCKNQETNGSDPFPAPMQHESFEYFLSKSAAFSDERITTLACPDCGKTTIGRRWVNQRDGRYMNIFTCPEHGNFLTRLRFKRSGVDGVSVNRLIYRADVEMLEYFRLKSSIPRRRGRGKSSRKKQGSSAGRGKAV